MAGKGWLGVTYAAVGDVKSTHQYDVTVEFQIAFDYGGWNNEGAPYEIYCNGQKQTGTATFSVPSGGGSWKWTTIAKKTFRITMDKSGASKTVNVGANITTGITPAKIDTGTVYGCTLPAVTWQWAVKYNANGGSVAPGSQTKTYGKSLTLSSTKPTRTGYTFKGWATSSTATTAAYQAGGSYTSNSAVTLYAVWQINTYAIAYNANGGSGAPSSQTKTYGQALTLSSTIPTRTNYNFVGWSTSSTGAPQYQAGGSYTDNKAATLYAVWELAYIPPKITDVKVQRCDSDGTPSDIGTCYSVSLSWVTEKADPTVKIEHKLSTDTDWILADESTKSGTSGVHTGTYGNDGLSGEKAYDIRITVTDSVGSSTYALQIAPVAFTMDFKAGGKGVSFGKPATIDYLVDSAWQMRSKTTDTGLEAQMRAEAEAGSIYLYSHATPDGNRGLYGQNADGTSVNILTVDPNNDIAIAGKRLMHLQQDGEGYWGMMNPNGSTGGYIRTPSPGIIPYQSGGSGNVGTANWPFTNGYFNNLYIDGTNINAFNKDTLWLSLNTYIKYRKVGRVVFVKGLSNNGKSLTSGSYTDVGTLPAGYRPYYDRYDFTFHCQGGELWTQSAYVTNAGVIRLYHAEGHAIGYWGFSLSYPAADA